MARPIDLMARPRFSWISRSRVPSKRPLLDKPSAGYTAQQLDEGEETFFGLGFRVYQGPSGMTGRAVHVKLTVREAEDLVCSLSELLDAHRLDNDPREQARARDAKVARARARQTGINPIDPEYPRPQHEVAPTARSSLNPSRPAASLDRAEGCERCNYDNHVCPGCGEPLPHGTEICPPCRAL